MMDTLYGSDATLALIWILRQGKVSRNGFVPPDAWKGVLAKAVMDMIRRYPHYQKVIDTKVMDLSVARKWSKLYDVYEFKTNGK